jgi:hypothetical protein
LWFFSELQGEGSCLICPPLAPMIIHLFWGSKFLYPPAHCWTPSEGPCPSECSEACNDCHYHKSTMPTHKHGYRAQTPDQTFLVLCKHLRHCNRFAIFVIYTKIFNTTCLS